MFNQFFAMLLEVILSKNGSMFSHIYLLFHFLEGKGILYHLKAYDPKIEENPKKLYFGGLVNRFLQLKVVFRKDPEISKECFAIFY